LNLSLSPSTIFINYFLVSLCISVHRLWRRTLVHSVMLIRGSAISYQLSETRINYHFSNLPVADG
jgi:hypothetical protein